MVPNGAAYSNYPAFATNGTKTPPGGSTESAKYALGMVPADTFPAEWANYLFYGATAGITRLNADTGSIKKEINSVLDNFNITPDATLNNQLLAALTKLKQEAALAAHPVGSLYWTSSTDNPAVTFGGGTWTQIKDKFVWAKGDNDTVNATGGAKTVTLEVANLPSHNHTFTGTAACGESGANHTHGMNHHHYTSGTTSNGGVDHTHSGTTGGMSANSSHAHNVGCAIDSTSYPAFNVYGTDTIPTASGAGLGGNNTYSPYCPKTNSVSIAHTHSFTTGGASSYTHQHPYGAWSGDSMTTANNSTLRSQTDEASAYLHSHIVTVSGTIGNTGSGTAVSIMPPYVVKYCWERVA